MPLLANEVMDESASVYLNDPAKTRWGYTTLLPYLRSALLELQAELEDNDMPTIHEVSAVLTVPPNTVLLTTPSDMVLPLKLYERGVGETRWEEMDELSWEPDADRDDKLHLWVYREGLIQLLGSSSPREVMLKYVRSLSALSSETSVIEVSNAKGFLAARTAGLAASFGGHATARGDAANGRAEYFKSKILSSLTKRTQDRPVRRRRFPWQQLSRR